MSSDQDYANFLDKANQDTGASTASTQSTSKVGTKAVDTEVPSALEGVEEYYVSEADEPFEPVSLKWSEDGLPSADSFSSLIGKDATDLTQKDFDPRGQYEKVVDAVKKAGSSDLGFFRVALGGSRAEYFVVSVDKKAKRLVGLKAISIES
jgi:hypothetical protein